MSAHTPGPWTIHTDPRFPNVRTILFPDGETEFENTAAASNQTEMANLRLCAAAPELLDALKGVFALMDEGFLVRNIRDDSKPDWAIKMLPHIARLKKAAEAIAKAEGNSNE